MNAAKGLSTRECKHILSRAKTMLHTPGSAEIDSNARISVPDTKPLTGVWVQTWQWLPMSDIWDGPMDSSDEPCRFLNTYTCPRCNCHWEDQWSCACNDECPSCSIEVEPEESVELDLTGKPAK